MNQRINLGACSAVTGLHSPKFQTENDTLQSTHRKNNPTRDGLQGFTAYGMIKKVGCKTNHRFGSLFFYTRRLIAAPLRGVFSLAFIRAHGVSLPKILTGTPHRNPSGLLFPCVQSANLCGVAHPLGRGVSGTTDNSTQGVKP